MTPFFENIEELQAAVSVNCTFDVRNISANAELAGREYLIPCIGEALWNTLLTAYEADTLSPIQAAAVALLQRSLANFTLYLHAPEGAIQWSDAGLLRREGDNHKTAYKYQEENLRQSLIQKGWTWVEHLVDFLEVKVADFPDYDPSKNRACIINSYKDFAQYVMLREGRYMFEALRGIIKDVECFTIEPCLGTPLYEEVKAQILADNLSTENARLLRIVKPALAYFTKYEAVVKGLATVTTDGLQTIHKGTQEGHRITSATNLNTADSLALNLRSTADRYMGKLAAFLEENAEDYPLYSPPATEETPDLCDPCSGQGMSSGDSEITIW